MSSGATQTPNRESFVRPQVAPLLVHVLVSLVVGTAFSFALLCGRPLIVSAGELVGTHLHITLPTYAWAQALAVALALIGLCFFVGLPTRLLRSFKKGIISPNEWIWAPAFAVFWILLDTHHDALAIASILVASLLTVVIFATADQKNKKELLPDQSEADTPVPEGGADLLGRGESIEKLISIILFERPEIIAVTGGYGDGKTSFLNLAMGRLRRSDLADSITIVRFNPWLAGDSNALVLSLLNSIVVQIKKVIVVPGLTRDAARYARAFLTLIPKTDPLKSLLSEPSQEQRILALANSVARSGRQVLIVLDDLDRMECAELETVLKILRGSDQLSSIPLIFLCAFDPAELANILKAKRPSQDTRKFIQKFFPVQLPLPKIDSGEIRDLLTSKLADFISRDGVSSDEELSKDLTKLWETGAAIHFRNLRTVKLFLNRIKHSLEIISQEVNVRDFIRLELVREIAPEIYDQIYCAPQYFYNGEFAFEVRSTKPNPYDEKTAAKERQEKYHNLVQSVPEAAQFVFDLVGELFPHFASYRNNIKIDTGSAADAERQKRIYHPRFFRQYFLLKVPTELFPQKDLKEFCSSVARADENTAATSFFQVYKSMERQPFRRWRFIDLLENQLAQLPYTSASGLCRGMARVSSRWGVDSFELLTAIRCTRETLARTSDQSEREKLLMNIFTDSGSDLYSVTLLLRLEEHEQKEQPIGLVPTIEKMKTFLTSHIRTHYLAPNAPSIYEQFGGDHADINRIEPHLFLGSWQALGADARTDQRKYLLNLFSRRPQELDNLLRLLFRVPFVDDYASLKSVIDYDEVSKLIAENHSQLNSKKVMQFQQRHAQEALGLGTTPRT